MTTYGIGDIRTGDFIIKNLSVLSGPWDDRLGAPESISVTVDMDDPDIIGLNLRNAATPAKAYLYVEESGVIMAAGPIWTRRYGRDGRTLELNAKGLGSIFDHRTILPLIAQTLGVDQWTIPDPADPTKTIANPVLTTFYESLSLGTIGKKWIQQMLTWTGGNLPIVFQDDEAGTHEREVKGVDFKRASDAISALSEVENGVEINFQGRTRADAGGLEWLFETGTNAQPLITSDQHLTWNVTVAESPAYGFEVTEDASEMGSLGWNTGGRQADKVLVARAFDPLLTDAGYPLMEIVDTSHTSVEFQSTLDSYAAANVQFGRTPSEVWGLTVKAYPIDAEGMPAGPSVNQYTVGDFADLKFEPYDGDMGGGPLPIIIDEFTDTYTDTFGEVLPGVPPASTGRGDPWFPAGGVFPNRIIGRSGDEKGDEIKLQFAPRVGS